MLSWTRKFLLASLFLAMFVICVWGLTFSPAYKRCVSEEHAHQTAQEQQDPLSNVGIFFRCEAAPLDRHAGALTAIGTIAIAFFTLTLWAVTDNALRLARDEFNATHRPKIYVQTISITERGETPGRYAGGDRIKEEAKPCEGIITVANGGDSAAFLVQWQSVVYLQTSGNAFTPPLDLAPVQRPNPNAPGISPGVIESMKHFQVRPVDRDWQAYQQGAGHKIFFIGRIIYEGPDKIRRTTGFCREWDNALGAGRWKPTNYSEFEFAY